MLYLRRRALTKIERVRKLELHRLCERGYEQARIEMGLSVYEFSLTKRWFLAARLRAELSGEPLSFDAALSALAAEHVGRVARTGRLLLSGHSRPETQRLMRADAEDFEELYRWWRDMLAAIPDSGDLREAA